MLMLHGSWIWTFWKAKVINTITGSLEHECELMLILFKTVNTKDWWSFFHHVKVMSVFTEKDKGIQICEKRTLMYKLMNGYMHLNKSTKRNLMVWSTFSNFRNAVCITKTLECRQQMNVFSLSRDSLISLNLISVHTMEKYNIFSRGLQWPAKNCWMSTAHQWHFLDQNFLNHFLFEGLTITCNEIQELLDGTARQWRFLLSDSQSNARVGGIRISPTGDQN